MSISAPTSAVTPLSRSAWLRLRRTLTAGLFLASTVAGVNVGLQGAAVSPVAPAVATAAPLPAPALSDGPAAHHLHGEHR